MPHGDAVVDRYGVELFGNATRGLDPAGHQLAHVFQVHMARHELRERVDDGNDGFVEIAILHAGGSPRSEEHTSELQSLMRISYAVFCLKKQNQKSNNTTNANQKLHKSTH